MVTIIYAKITDLKQLIPYLKELQPHKYSVDQEIIKDLERLYGFESIKIVVLKKKEDIIGFSIFEYMHSEWYNGTYIYIHILYTRLEYRNNGFGKLLINKIIEYGKEKSVIGLQLDSGFQRTDAHMFYEKIGIKKVGYLFSCKI